MKALLTPITRLLFDKGFQQNKIDYQHLKGFNMARLSPNKDIIQVPMPEYIELFIKVGPSFTLHVAVDEHVQPGQVLQSDALEQHPNLLSPVAGQIQSIYQKNAQWVLSIKVAQAQPPSPKPASSDPLTLSPEALLQAIEQAGVVGQGGAGFQTVKKLKLAQNADTLVVNATECEPFVRCDESLVLAHSTEILLGALALAKCSDINRLIILINQTYEDGIEQLKNAIKTLNNKIDIEIIIEAIPVTYPTGSEKTISQILFDLEVPSKHYISDINKVVFNVSTCFAVWETLWQNKILSQRVISIFDAHSMQINNYRVYIGTPIQNLLQQLGYDIQKDSTIVEGGPMMGQPLNDHSAPIQQTTIGLMLFSHKKSTEQSPCIRCGACEEVCPIYLLPQELYYFSQVMNEKKMAELNLFDCIECGCCAYVCPSNIPLVQYYKSAKKHIRDANNTTSLAQYTQNRYEQRETRIEQEIQEREQRLQAKRQAAKAMLANENKEQNPDDLKALKKQAVLKAQQRAKQLAEQRKTQKTDGENQNKP